MEIILAAGYTIPLVYSLRNIYKFKFSDNRKCYPLDKINTGDIIYISHNGSNIVNNIVNIEFTHIAMAYKDPSGELYLMELTSQGDSPNNHSHPDIYPFISRYSNYNGYFCVRPCKYEIPNDEIFNTYKRLKKVGITFDYKFIGNFLKSRIGILRNVHVPNDDGEYELCCSEFVYLLLCNLNLIQYNDDDFHNSFRFLISDKIDDIYYDIYDIDEDYRNNYKDVIKMEYIPELTT